jgi:hypothetical protein
VKWRFFASQSHLVLPKKNNYRLFTVFTLCGNSRVPTGVLDSGICLPRFAATSTLAST